MAGLKEHGSATVDELRAFLADFRGKSAKEMLGSLSESGLLRAEIQATLASALVIGAFTVGPYFLAAKSGSATDRKNSPPPASASVSPSTPPAAAAAVTKPADASAAGSTDVANPPAAARGTPPDLEQAAKVLGVSETKSADPKDNPREKDLDSLLDKIK